MALAGVAVAVAFCPIESAAAAVSLPTEWPFGVTEGSYFVPHLSA